MYQTQSQITIMLVIVAVLAVVAGVVIVLVTSPKSLELSNLEPARSPTATAQLGTAPPSVEPTAAPADTDTPTARPSMTPLATRTPRPPSATPTRTRIPSATPTATITPLATLPADVRALAIINITDGGSARLRAVPGGDIIAAIPGGATVQLLKKPSRELDGITWVQIRDENGVVGWVASDLLLILPSP
nr:SH3 domain-containing protein [Chloroflexota bacterium]